MMITIPFAILGFLVFCSLLILLLYLYQKKCKILNDNFPSFRGLRQQRVSHKELVEATNGFNESCCIGKGGFGSVYKGVLKNGEVVAVKVLNMENPEYEKSFKAECKALKNARHRNLSRLITTCSLSNFRALVYKYISNGNLEELLHGRTRQLGIKERIQIALDVSHALEYLHHDCHVPIVHCDIKPSNILLDEDLTAKVTDFGIAKILSTSSSSSFNVRGSIGYIAPENGLGERASRQGDVYSFGIVVLELLTRKKRIDDMFIGGLTLKSWVNRAFPYNMEHVLDRNLMNEVLCKSNEKYHCYNSLLSLAHIGLSCCKEIPQHRPTMREVSKALEDAHQKLLGIHCDLYDMTMSSALRCCSLTNHTPMNVEENSSLTFSTTIDVAAEVLRCASSSNHRAMDVEGNSTLSFSTTIDVTIEVLSVHENEEYCHINPNPGLIQED